MKYPDLDPVAAATWTNFEWKRRAQQLRAYFGQGVMTRAQVRARHRALRTAYRHRTRNRRQR